MRGGEASQLHERIGPGMTECKRDTQRHGAVAQAMLPNHLRRRPRRGGRSRLDAELRTKGVDAMGTEHIRRTSSRSMRGDLLQKAEYDIDRALRRNSAEPHYVDSRISVPGARTSPRVRGEVGALLRAGRGGASAESELRRLRHGGTPPHPDPLPARGEREQRRRAALTRDA